MSLATVKINGIDLGEAKIGTLEINDDNNDYIDIPTINVGKIEHSGTFSVKVFPRAMKRLMQQIAPDSIQAKGYYIENHRGRNILKQW